MATKSRNTAAAGTTKKDGHAEMPPPPLPQKKILEGEVIALGNCFRSAVVKTGQVYSFHADSIRLGIDQYASHPPRSLTASLGREIEKFDQLCDAIESRLLRATAVLKRDLMREENRLKAAQAVEAQRPKPSSPATETIPSSPTQLVKSIEQSLLTQGGIAGRRTSTISLSSLHRPTFPHKLDLSSLRLNPEDLISLSTNGLASPVTLAPKSARLSTTTELPHDLMAALASTEASGSNTAVDIDLTLDTDSPNDESRRRHPVNIDSSLGSSADKPIELDLDLDMADIQDMSSIFGQDTSSATDVEVLFSHSDVDTTKNKSGENIGLGIFSSTVENATESRNNIFSSMNSHQLQIGGESKNNTGQAPNTSFFPSLNDASGAGSMPTNMSSAESPFDINSIDLASIDQTFLMASSSEMNLMEELFKVEGDSHEMGVETNRER